MQEQPDEDEDQQQRIVDYLSERRQWSFENAQTLPAKLDRKVINGNPANHFGNVTWIVQAATRTNEGFRTYVALERLGKGSQAQLHTVNDVCAQDPNLSKKNVRDGMRELARLGFIDLRHESPRSAMRACVIFNPARADVDPRFYRLDFTAGPLPKMANPRKREPRRTA